MKAAEADAFARRLALLREGRAVEAASLAAPPRERRSKKKEGGEGGERGISLGSDDSETGGSDSEMEEDDGGEGAAAAGKQKKGSKEEEARKASKKKKSSSSAPGTPPPPPPAPPLPSSRSHSSAPPTSLCIEAARELEAELFRRQPASVCANCGCHNPALRRDGVSKLFVARLQPHREAQNAAAGVPVVPAVPIPGAGKGEEEGRGQAAHEAVALEQALTAATATATPSTTTTTLSERRGLTGAAAAGLRLMTPAEAREVARRLWAANEALLRELYAKNAPGGVFFSEPRGGGAGGKRVAAASTALRWREAYRSFFVSTVAVPPNRLRPPSRLGDATFEHPHNVALAAVVSSSADVASAAAPRRLGGGPDDSAEAGGAAAPPPDLAAGLRAWLALQSALNSLIDSSAPDARSANAGAAGVRQALEKKEVSDQFFFLLPLEQK